MGHFLGTQHPPEHHVEQVNWLQMDLFSQVLCQAWEVPEWHKQVARHLSLTLQKNPAYTPLLCYQDFQLAGCGLLLGNQMHLWGALTRGALLDLLNYSLLFSGGKVETSLPAGFEVPLQNVVQLEYSLL